MSGFFMLTKFVMFVFFNYCSDERKFICRNHF